MPDFIASLSLVAVAQIPLLLKLWLDHKGAVGGFKLELYKRQVDICIKLSSDLCRVQANCEGLVSLLNEGSFPAEKDDSSSLDLGTPYFKNNDQLMHAARDAELLLPVEVCVDFPKYLTCSTRLWVKAFAPKASSTDLSPNQIWEEQQNLFNTLFNQLRIICGTDTLSKHTLRQFSSAAANKTSLIVRKYEP